MVPRRTFAITLAAALIVPLAAVTTSSAACEVSVDVASAEQPHLIDPSGDWSGVATGREDGLVPAADLYREGIDITKAWITRDAEGNLKGTIEVANLSTLQPNAIFYLLWHYPGSDIAKEHRWVSGRLKGYDVAFTYGYMATNPVTGNTSFVTEGETTGAINEGAPGTVVMDIPKGGQTLSGASNDDWGAPAPGATLSFPEAESRFLAGTPEPLPPNPSGFRHGFVYETDISDNAIICDAKA